MSEQFWNMLITVLSGVFVYVLSQLFTEFILRPIQEYKKLKGKTAKLLTYYACCYSNPCKNDDIGNAQEWRDGEIAIRELASEVCAFAEIRPPYVLTWFAIPKYKALKEASRCLIGISNSFFVGESRFEYMECTRMDVSKVRNCMRINEN